MKRRTLRSLISLTRRHRETALIANATACRALTLDAMARTTTLRRAFLTELRRRWAAEIVLGRSPTSNCQSGQLRDAGSGRCGPGLGIDLPRDSMPQVKSADLPTFVAYAIGRGVSITPSKVRADDLSPTQREFRQERVDAMDDDTPSSPLLISNDDYILDGTHRWVKAWQASPDTLVPVLRIGLPLREALSLMRAFPEVVYAENAERFHLPENYDKIRTLPDGKELWAGANDWESGWSYAWIQPHYDPDNGHPRVAKEPTQWTEVDHSKCLGCGGVNSNDSDGAPSREQQRECQDYSEAQVEKWVKGITANWDESQHPRDASGKFGSGGSSPSISSPGEHGGDKGPGGKTGVVAKLVKAGSMVAHAEHVASTFIKDKIGAGIDKLPYRAQEIVGGAFAVLSGGFKAAFSNFTVMQALAERTAKERGATPEQARKLRGVLSTIDNKTFETFKVAALAGVHAAHAPAILSATVPVATASYLAYSTARNPAATLRAADGLISDTVDRLTVEKARDPRQAKKLGVERLGTRNVAADVVGNADDEGIDLETEDGDGGDEKSIEGVANALADALEAHDYDDWYVALLSSALDHGGEVADQRGLGHVENAIEIADAVYTHRSEDTSEPADDDEDALLKILKGKDGATQNAFCATGTGGGVDPSCSPGGKDPTTGEKGHFSEGERGVDWEKDTGSRMFQWTDARHPATVQPLQELANKKPLAETTVGDFTTRIVEGVPRQNDPDRIQGAGQIFHRHNPTGLTVAGGYWMDYPENTSEAGFEKHSRTPKEQRASEELERQVKHDPKGDFEWRLKHARDNPEGDLSKNIFLEGKDGKVKRVDATTGKVVNTYSEEIHSLSENAFCATGAGGGVDPSCAPGGKAASPEIPKGIKGSGTKDSPYKVGGDIKLAAKLLAAGHHVKLAQPEQVATLLDRLEKVAKKAEARGEAAPKIDLCKVSAPKSNLFCQDSLGIPRIEMPQMRGLPVPGTYAAEKAGRGEAGKKSGKVDLSAEFIQHMQASGIKTERTDIRASHLRASQSEIVGARVGQLIRETREGNRDLREKPIFVTKDNYIVDGHHHWAAIVGEGYSRDKDLKVPVYKLDTDIGTALRMANEYTKKAGLAPKSGTTTNAGGYVVNPFVSEAQRRACYAADDPDWDCDEWSEATPKGKLPERSPTANASPSCLDPALWEKYLGKAYLAGAATGFDDARAVQRTLAHGDPGVEAFHAGSREEFLGRSGIGGGASTLEVSHYLPEPEAITTFAALANVASNALVKAYEAGRAGATARLGGSPVANAYAVEPLELFSTALNSDPTDNAWTDAAREAAAAARGAAHMSGQRASTGHEVGADRESAKAATFSKMSILSSQEARGSRNGHAIAARAHDAAAVQHDKAAAAQRAEDIGPSGDFTARAHEKAAAAHREAAGEHREVAQRRPSTNQGYESLERFSEALNYDPDQPRGPGGKWTKGGGEGAEGKAGSAKSPIASEPTTPPPPGRVYAPDVTADHNKDGVTDYARIGVPAMSVPPPPSIGRLPNLTPAERKVEHAFISTYEKDPDKVAGDFKKIVLASTKPGEAPTFGTDDAKVLTDAWSHPDPSVRSVNRATLNCALHQTANAVAKRAFLQHLDTLEKGDEILVTVGGCGCGKGYSLGKDKETGKPFVPVAFEMKQRAKAVWDSAGDQNATENPWLQAEAEKRGLKVNYAFVHADPYTQWSHPERGVVKRAGDPSDGRMVDAKVFADSYALGAKNHAAFADANKNNPNASFIFLAAGKNGPERIPGVPEAALKLDAKHLADFAIKTVKEGDAPAHVKRGGTIGERIWRDVNKIE